MALMKMPCAVGSGGSTISYDADTSNQLGSITTAGGSYTATEDCIMLGSVSSTSGSAIVYVDNAESGVYNSYTLLSVSQNNAMDIGYTGYSNKGIPIAKGTVVSTRSGAGTYNLKFYKMA